MFEDKWLLWKLKQGRSEALCSIYKKYKNNMLALAVALSNNKTISEDIVHDCFVSFAQSAGRLQLRNSLRSYLLTSIANRVRNLGRDKIKSALDVEDMEIVGPSSNQPERLAISNERIRKINSALIQLPYEQQEVIILHFQSELTFKEIAESQSVSVNTIQSQYRYGIDKLRSILDGEV
ncbi:MAG: sigma-70 family RNA polymerase sigma factor [Planctomycetes bacterium]|nr:sigma-70 family RNA polymerase sigma factor [Planctomycetota bacterium]MBU1518961.1 sigma-70 family RNA polymerase sigma factor [Planctomycetota bacterium]MBU2457460.1 sigma-70 family RNA polymerase sigma factor [Planctomycetota bacterium]MBU2597233.1 sigma-70 family RNA polymerase sigma factor [Planctomycetota bacterium]